MVYYLKTAKKTKMCVTIPTLKVYYFYPIQTFNESFYSR